MRKWIILPILSAIITGVYYALILNSETSIILNSSVRTFETLKNCVFIGYGATGLFTGLGVRNVLKKAKENNAIEMKRRVAIQERSSDPVKQLLFETEEYLKTDETIPSIKNGLTAIANALPAVKRQYDNVNLLVGNRFDADSLSYKKFIAPVENLYQTMTKAVADLIQKLKLFDEAECLRKIDKYKKLGNTDLAKQQEEILTNYFKYITDIMKSIDEISLRFDKLILEIGKLSDDELKKSLAMLEELDSVITHTKLYNE